MPVEALQNSRFCFWLTFVCVCVICFCAFGLLRLRSVHLLASTLFLLVIYETTT